MARLCLSFALMLAMLAVSESAPRKQKDGSGELPPEDPNSLENEGFFPRRRFGDPPLGRFPVGFNPRPDGAPWMSESGDPVFPVYDDEHEGRKDVEEDEEKEIHKSVNDDDEPDKEHPSHEVPIPDDREDEEPHKSETDEDVHHKEEDDEDEEPHKNETDNDVHHKKEDDEDDEPHMSETDNDVHHKKEDDEDDEPHMSETDNDVHHEEDEEDEEGEHKVDFDEPKIPEDDEDSKDEDINDSEQAPYFGSFMFDTPFFNERQVSKYFQHLEKALEQVFRQTLDEASLLNGTFANTTEEEVDIDCKKFVVQKSIIQGKDNHSSIYIEALSASPEGNKTKVTEDSGL